MLVLYISVFIKLIFWLCYFHIWLIPFLNLPFGHHSVCNIHNTCNAIWWRGRLFFREPLNVSHVTSLTQLQQKFSLGRKNLNQAVKINCVFLFELPDVYLNRRVYDCYTACITVRENIIISSKVGMLTDGVKIVWIQLAWDAN